MSEYIENAKVVGAVHDRLDELMAKNEKLSDEIRQKDERLGLLLLALDHIAQMTDDKYSLANAVGTAKYVTSNPDSQPPPTDGTAPSNEQLRAAILAIWTDVNINIDDYDDEAKKTIWTVVADEMYGNDEPGYFLVKLEDGVWLTNGEGDPPRTTRPIMASVYGYRSLAENALATAREYRDFPDAEIHPVSSLPNEGTRSGDDDG